MMRRPTLFRAILFTLVAATLAAGAVASEAILEYRQYHSTLAIRDAVAALHKEPFDSRSIPHVIHDALESNDPLTPPVTASTILEYAEAGTDSTIAYRGSLLPLGGIAHRHTLLGCNESGQYPTYVSDGYGFANPDEAWNAGHPQIVIVGDSFMHGYCVPPESTFATALRKKWPSTVSVGTGGAGPFIELAQVTEYAVPVRAPIVLWVYFENDLDNIADERRRPELVRYLDPAFQQHLFSSQPAIDSALAEWLTRAYRSGDVADLLLNPPTLRRIVTLTTIRHLITGRVPDPRTEVTEFRKVLSAARDRVGAYGGKLVFVFLPEWSRFFAASTQPHDRARGEVLGAARELGLPVIDLTAAFGANQHRSALFGKDSIAPAHYSSQGYALTASVVESALDSLIALDVLPHLTH